MEALTFNMSEFQDVPRVGRKTDINGVEWDIETFQAGFCDFPTIITVSNVKYILIIEDGDSKKSL